MTTNTAATGSMTSGDPTSITFTEAVKTSLRKWRQFSGRASRKEFWSFLLVAGLTLIATALIGSVLVLVPWVLLLVPYWAVTVRRLHDTGHSGALFFISLIPYVGGFILIYFLAKSSQDGANKYGPNPYGLGWTPTHRVPDEGMSGWTTPGPSLQPAGRLDGQLELIVAERADHWTRVEASNGWTCWVDGRLLVPAR